MVDISIKTHTIKSLEDISLPDFAVQIGGYAKPASYLHIYREMPRLKVVTDWHYRAGEYELEYGENPFGMSEKVIETIKFSGEHPPMNIVVLLDFDKDNPEHLRELIPYLLKVAKIDAIKDSIKINGEGKDVLFKNIMEAKAPDSSEQSQQTGLPLFSQSPRQPYQPLLLSREGLSQLK